MRTAGYPTVGADEVAWLTQAQMLEVDRLMVEDLRIELIQMMENAGRNLAQLVLDRFEPGAVTVLAGGGGNGGGGLAAARHLWNRGVDVNVTLGVARGALTPAAAHQLDILGRMGVRVHHQPRRADVVIDALIGYSLRGAPRDRIAALIGATPNLGEWIVALDTPSGLNVSDGSLPGAAVCADATMTLALPKVGLRGSAQVGELYLGDISVPPSVYEELGVGPAPDFAGGAIIEVLR